MDQEVVGANVRCKCQFVVPKKNRPCRMLALVGEQFCGEHIVLDTENSTRQSPVPEDRVRIKCPLDPRHTCYLKKLEKHLKVCNAREKERPPYYVRDINAGDSVPQPGGPTIHQLSDRALLELLDKISTLHDEHVSRPEVAEEAAHEALADSLLNATYGADTLKHLRQNSSLLAVLRDAGQLDADATFVELGSGKAQLSFWLARAISSRSQIVLVDLASHRHKAENKLKDLEDMPTVQRLRIDIRHLSLAGSEACRGRPVVAISKHLCGAATDLGIRAATAAATVQSSGPPSGATASTVPSSGSPPSEAQPRPAPETQPNPLSEAQPEPTPEVQSSSPSEAQPDQPDPPSEAQPDQPDPPSEAQPDPRSAAAEAAVDVRGIMIAVCCHHRVDWPSYVGKQFLQEVCRFSAADFSALKGVAAWATCGTPSWDAPPPPRRSGRDGAATGRPLEPAAGGLQGVSGDPQPNKRSPATADSHQDSKRPRLNGQGPPADQPGPGSREASAGRYQRLGLTPERRTDVGFRCKRLLDEGRRRYLLQRGFTARLLRYVPSSISPENVVLLATR